MRNPNYTEGLIVKRQASSVHYIVLLMTLATTCVAGDSAGQAGGFLRIGLGPRAKALGDSYTAIADNSYAAYYNPAGLGFLKGKEASLSYSVLTFDRTFSYAGFSCPVPPTAGFSFGVLQSGFKNTAARADNGEATGQMIEDTQYAFLLGFAIRFNDKLALGITPTLLYSKVFDVSSSSVGLDLGLMARPVQHLSFGFVIKELGQSFKYQRNATGAGDQTTKDHIPTVMKLGAAYNSALNGTIKGILLATDLEWSTEQPLRGHFGIEANLADKLFPRVGVDNRDFTAGFAIPFSIGTNRFHFDYSFVRDSRAGMEFGSQDFSLAYVF